MPKSIIPRSQEKKDLVGANVETGQLSLGAVIATVPVPPQFNAPAVASQLVQFGEQADRYLASAQRAVITTPDSAAKATDFLAALNDKIKAVDEARKGVTGQFDKLVKGLNAMFTSGPTAKLNEAKALLQKKLGLYTMEQRVKAEAEAKAERERIAAEAAAAASQAIEDGDSDEALEILQGAAAVDVQPEKVVVRGGAAVLSGTKRKVGTVSNPRAFMAWIAETKSPMALAMLGGVSFGQRELNQLAAAVIALREATGDDTHGVPGFVADVEETFGAR